jgi:glutamate/tyrosine decarboxylase-like PLP-dependent enzyme
MLEQLTPIDKVTEICKKYNLWLHVDAAYGGAAMQKKTGYLEKSE